MFIDRELVIKALADRCPWVDSCKLQCTPADQDNCHGETANIAVEACQKQLNDDLASLTPEKVRGDVARRLAVQDVQGRSDYADKTAEQVWENVLAEGLDEEYLEDADEILSIVNAQFLPVAKCGKCGGDMSVNSHPKAGLPPDYLTVGTKFVCIPCTVNGRHLWAERAMKAETELDKYRLKEGEQLAVVKEGELPEIPEFNYDDEEYIPYLQRGAINYSKMLSNYMRVVRIINTEGG